MSKSHTPFRTDSILGNLPPDRQEQIAEWILGCKEGDRYQFAVDQLAADGLKVGRSTVFDWFRGWRLRQQISSADSFASQVQDALKALNLGLTSEQLETAGQLIFTNRALEREDAEEFREMEKLRLAKLTARTKGRQTDEQIAIAKRRVSLLEKNAAEAKAKLEKVITADKGGLSAEALKTIEQAAKILS